MGSSGTRDWTRVSCTGRRIPIHCTTREVFWASTFHSKYLTNCFWTAYLLASLKLRAHLTCAFGLAHRHLNFNISNKWCIITLPWSLLHPAFLILDNLPSLSSSRQEFGNDPLLHLNLFCHQNRLPKLSPCQSYLQHLSNFPLSLLSLLTALAQALISFLDYCSSLQIDLLASNLDTMPSCLHTGAKVYFFFFFLIRSLSCLNPLMLSISLSNYLSWL